LLLLGSTYFFRPDFRPAISFAAVFSVQLADWFRNLPAADTIKLDRMFFLVREFVHGRAWVMMSVMQNWQNDLIANHPRLFGDASQGYAECGEGWWDLLERACVRIEAAIGPHDTFETEQIKQKYGTLRWYYAGRLSEAARGAVEEAIDLAEARSACTCETCGAEGRIYDRGGWLTTACTPHARGEPVPIKGGFENLRVVRRLVDGEARIVSCRRYNRIADAFVDVDPASLGMEE